MIRDLEGKMYEEHLKALGMTTSFTISRTLAYRGQFFKVVPEDGKKLKRNRC